MLVDLLNNFIHISGQTMNVQISIVFLHLSNKQLKIEFLNKVLLTNHKNN